MFEFFKKTKSTNESFDEMKALKDKIEPAPKFKKGELVKHIFCGKVLVLNCRYFKEEDETFYSILNKDMRIFYYVNEFQLQALKDKKCQQKNKDKQ
jgi:hypothetical protein